MTRYWVVFYMIKRGGVASFGSMNAETIDGQITPKTFRDAFGDERVPMTGLFEFKNKEDYEDFENQQ